MSQDLDAFVRRHARRAARWCPPWMDAEDLAQDAHLALAQYEPDTQEPVHRQNKLRQRARGAMIDVLRTTNGWQERRMMVSLEPAEAELITPATAPDDPERIAQLRRAVERLSRHRSSRLRRCVELLAAGWEPGEIAVEFGCTTSRISQLRHEAAHLIAAEVGWV